MATGYSPMSENDSGILRSSSEGHPLSEPFSTIIRTTELPVIVQYDSSIPLDKRLVTPAFNPREPLLIHSKHRARRIRARCVQFQSESRTFMDCDCDAMIPEVYPGWFAVFGNPSTQARDPIVPHYRRVSQLAISSCTRFLVAGDRPIDVLLARQGEGEHVDFHPTPIHPGTVLQKGKLFSLFSHANTKVKKRFRKTSKKKPREDKYVSAYDGHGHTFFIPCDLDGLFYVLDTQNARLSIPVLRFHDVIKRYKFPVLVKLVQGQIPSSSSFNGTLVLFESQMTSFAITSNLNLYKEMVFEILEDSALPFLLSAPEENESEKYSNALSCHESHEEFFLKNIRFQNRSSDYNYIRDSVRSMDSTNFSKEKHSGRLPEISCVRIEELQLFPPSPATSKVVSDDKVPHSVLSLNLNEIKRTVTFDRPNDIKFDTIPIEMRGVSGASEDSMDDERRTSDTNNSASQPSLQNLVISGGENLPPPPPTPELLQSECVEDEDAPDNVSKEYGQKNCRVWSADTLTKDSTLSAEADERDGVRLRDKMGNKKGDENGCPNCSEVNVLEDENGYVIASELTVPLNGQRNLRPASYVSIHPPENHYDIIPVRANELAEDLDFDPSISAEARGQINSRGGIMHAGSHYYNNLQEPSPEEVDETKPKYVNISFLETETVRGAGFQECIYHVPRKFGDQTGLPTQNGQSAITQELPTLPRKEVLRQTFESSADKNSGYMNLQDITCNDNIAASHKDRFLDRLKQQDLKKNTQQALEALNEDDFTSMVQAEDPLDRLKELLPQISKSDVFKIGLCLKDI